MSEKESQSFKETRSSEPAPTNSISPNRQRHIETLSDSEDFTGSYTSYSSSGEYSSVGDVLNNASNRDKKAFFKPLSVNEGNTDSQFSHGILSQVFKMQSLLEEYQTSLTALEIEKADNQQELNKFDKRLKVKAENEERYKEDIWNLELNNQELTQKINDLTQDLLRSNLDHTRLSREKTLLTQELDSFKAIQQSWEQKLKDTQQTHEQEIVALKKTLHMIRIEKDNLSKQIQDLLIVHTTTAKTTTLRHIDSKTNLRDIEPTATAPCQIKNTISNNSHRRHSRHVEIDALTNSLNQAHEIIHTMQNKIDLEREERIEVDKLLREAQETIENFNTQSIHSHHCKQSSSHQNHTLGDELAGSTDNFKSLSTQEKNGSLELTYVILPSQSNIDMNASLSSPINLKKSNESEGDIHIVNETYGSLLTQPESYFYKSRRNLQEEKKASPSAMFASTAVDSILNSKLELFPEVRKRQSVDEGFVAALTKTMIGDWMWKYTRKVVGSGISENRHRRFFWIHPYTQTLYWSAQEPGASTSYASTKSALVESFILLDHLEKSRPPGILIKTPTRGLKLECVDMPSHHAWIKSLQFILADNKEDMQPHLSRLSSVSKSHYQNRKKSCTLVEATLSSNMFNNSTLVDLSTTSSNFLSRQL